MKKCTGCNETKPKSEFFFKDKAKGYLMPRCKVCERTRKRLTGDNGKCQRKSHLKNRYGITLDDYERMLKEQGSSCKLCGAHQSTLRRRLAVDHCHDTNRVRGLLCDDCNIALGKMKDNIETLYRAIDYLKEKG